MQKKIIALLILFSSTLLINAQTDSVKLFTGRIINQANEKLVFAQVINLKKNQAVLTDTTGRFHIFATNKDSLLITSLGYEKKIIPVRFFLRNEQLILKEKIYDISSVDIYALRWQDFVYDFMHAPEEDLENKTRITAWIQTLFSPNELAMITAAASVGIPINYKTKKQKAREKVAELEQQEKTDEIYTKRYTRELVASATGLHGNDLTNFIQYCNFSKDFVTESSDYQLIMAIKSNFARFNEKKKRGKY